jgi:hypothetical protein
MNKYLGKISGGVEKYRNTRMGLNTFFRLFDVFLFQHRVLYLNFTHVDINLPG